MTSRRDRPRTGYGALMRAPGLPALAALSGLGRLGLSATSLALILSIARRTGSFAAAGEGTAAFALASASLAPVRGWLADRYSTALTVGLLGTACGLALITIVPAHSLGLAGLAIICAASGATTPPLGAVTKSRLSMTFQSDDHARQMALSFDTVIDIAALVAGPSLAGIIVSGASADAALATSAALILLGSIGTAVTPQIRLHRRPAPVPAAPVRHQRYVISQPVLRQTVIAMCGAGAAIGAVEVIVPALATSQHTPGESGAVLAVLFGASSISGLLYGKIRWTTSLTRRYRALAICLTASLIPLTLAHSIPAMAILITLPGLAFGPALISAFLLAQQFSTVDKQNQANAWIATANTAGAALGLAVGGLVTAKSGITTALLSAILFAAAGALATTGLNSRSLTAGTAGPSRLLPRLSFRSGCAGPPGWGRRSPPIRREADAGSPPGEASGTVAPRTGIATDRLPALPTRARDAAVDRVTASAARFDLAPRGYRNAGNG